MDLYIVIGSLEHYSQASDKHLTHDSFESKNTALEHAVALAHGQVSIGGTSRKYKLRSVIKLNTTSLRVSEMNLVIEDGVLGLRESGEKT